MPKLIGPTETVTIGPTETERFRNVTVEGTLTVEGELSVIPELTATATDVDTSTTTTTRERDLATESVDVDSGTSLATRTRDLTTILRFVVESGTTETIEADETKTTNEVTVEGDLTVEGTLNVDRATYDSDAVQSDLLRERKLVFDATDTDTSSATAELVRELIAQATDTDASSQELTRLRNLLADPVDADSASATTTRVRALVASASDTDASLAVLIPRSRETDPRALAIDIMEQTYNWPNDKPDVFRSEEIPQKAKQNNSDPAIYVHKPSSGEIERFSADGIDMTEDESVELHVWILDTTNPERSAREYRNEIVNTFAEYTNDNYGNTEFHRIEPTNSTDFRQEHIARQTDHYIYSVEIDTHRLEQQL